MQTQSWSPVGEVSEDFISQVKELFHDTSIEDLRITFTKADGSDREMLCTINEAAIPADKHPKGTGRAASEGIQRVYDLEVGEWRSFKWSNVKRVVFGR